MHPQPQMPLHQATQQNPTATEGAQERTLDSNYTSHPTRTAAQPPPRAQGSAPSTAK